MCSDDKDVTSVLVEQLLTKRNKQVNVYVSNNNGKLTLWDFAVMLRDGGLTIIWIFATLSSILSVRMFMICDSNQHTF